MPKESFFVASDVVPILCNKLQYLRKVYYKELEQYLMQFDALEKSVEILQIRVFKNCNKWSPVYKDYWRWKVYKLNKCWYSNRKKSNQGWNTPIYLKNNGLHMKVPLIFTFLIMIFYLCFYHQLWDKWVCMHIGNSSGHIGQIQSRFPKYLWMYDTEWNAHQIDVLDNFFD